MKRVIYEKNPLIEVVLQIRFPTILSLNSIDPINFQEAIRKEYPIYNIGIENEQEIEFKFASENENFFPLIKQNKNHNHTFVSENGQYKINLTSSFISISTVSYTRWEEMLAKFDNPLKKFIELYQPPFFERIGLRYIDAFSKEKLNITDKKWSELIQPVWLGPLLNHSEEKIINLGVDTEYILDDDISRAKIHTGLGLINNEPEKVFIVDSDMIHIGNIPINEYSSIIEYLHNNASEIIKSVIKTDLHNAMKPGDEV